jgi:hypothetical protein
VGVTWIVSLVATVLVACRQTESVLVSGPVLFFGGMALAGVAAGTGYRRAVWIGIVHCAICVFAFVLVSVAAWGPREAREPLTLLGAIYVIAALPISALAWSNPPREVDPGVCARCGYSLFGLHEPRCPECGTSFDPKLLLTLTPLKARPQDHPA